MTKTMVEAGAGISNHGPQRRLNRLVFSGNAKRIRRGLDDPPISDGNAGIAEETWSHYRRIQNEIRAYVSTPQEAIAGSNHGGG